ncbi:MAG: hypothetical protein M1541_09405, partial [Acidobacteria bacterium]|nr:hypothetical protein [Acidobacteriota bacterium]
MRNFIQFAAFAGALLAQGPVPKLGSFERSGAVILSNNILELTVTVQGASLARLVLADDPAAVNPLWEPSRMVRETGGTAGFRSGTGHF